MAADRLWFARCQYPGKRAFAFGTVSADGYEHARDLLLKKWGEVLPHPAPETFEPVPGQIIIREG